MRFIFCCLFSLFVGSLIAQNEGLKHDYIWLTGYGSFNGSMEQGGTVIDFSNDTLESYYEYRDIDFEISNTTMCNEQGELMFSTNNEVVANSLNIIMTNGNNLNPNNSITQVRGRQAVLALPSPTVGDSIYYIFHNEISWEDQNDVDSRPLVFNIFYTIVDMSCCGENPLGTVIDKNISLISEDTLGYGKLTATRHANGRDWWILAPKYDTKSYNKILFHASGIDIIEQEISEFDYHIDGVGQGVFTPDGSKYIKISAATLYLPSYLDIFDFDRCSGELFNPTRIQLENALSGYGLAVSPNSRFLYSSYNGKFYQYDLQSPNYDSILIDEYDGFTSPFPTPPFLAQLAPDNKIYFATYSTNNVLHVIHNPNELGLDCNLEQHGVQLPTYNDGTLPNHPNYHLGRLIGSPCDTIDWTIDTTSVNNININPLPFQVSPNPTKDKIQFSTNTKSNYIIQNAVGQILQSGQTEIGDNSLSLSHLRNGIYFITLEGRIPKVAKFVILK